MRHRRLGVLLAVGLLLGLSLVLGLARSEEAQALESDEQRLLELINAYRADNGLGTLSPSATLQAAAERHSEDMSTYGFFSHTTEASSYYAVGSNHADRVQAEGYPADSYTAENLAVDYATPEEVLVAWQNSPAHNAALLDGSYTAAGLGHVGAYWTLDMGSVASASPAPTQEETQQTTEAEETGEEQYESGQYENGQYDQYGADQYNAADQYENGQYDTESSTAETPAADQYETASRAADAEEADPATDRAAAADAVEETPGSDGAEPQPEAVERYVAEARAAEDQYDAQEISGASPDEDAPDDRAQQETTAAEARAAAEAAEAEAAAQAEETAAAATEAAQAEAAATAAAAQAAEQPEAPAADDGEEEPVAEEVATENPAAHVPDGDGETGNVARAEAPEDEESVYGLATLPDTGGVKVPLLAVGLLLVGGGLLGRRALR